MKGQCHGCGQGAKWYSQPSILLINSLPFHLLSIKPTIHDIQLFRNLTMKHPRSRSWERAKVKVTYYTQYRTDARHIRFTSNGPTIPDMAKIMQTLKKHIPNLKSKFAKITVSNWIFPKSNRVIAMTTEIELLRFVVIGWVVLTLLYRADNNFLVIDATAVSWVKVIKRSSSTFCHAYILFPSYLKYSSSGFDVRGKILLRRQMCLSSKCIDFVFKMI